MTVPDTRIVKDSFAIRAMQVWAEAAPYGAIDIETTIANPFRGEVKLVSVAVTFDGVISWVFHNDGFLELARPLLENTQWVMHNGLFDRLMMKLFGYDLPLKHDTMAMQYLLDPDEPKSLEELSEKYLGLEPYKDVDYQNILDEPFEKVAEMNAEDVRRTLALVQPLGDQLNADAALRKVYLWLLMPAIDVLIDVSLDGMPVDQERLASLTVEFTDKVDTLLSTLREATPPVDSETYGKDEWKGRKRKADPPPQFNPASVEQVRHIIFDQWNLPVLEYTKDKQGNDTTTPSTNADVLLQLETDFAVDTQETWLASLRSYRKGKKVLDGYLLSWPKLITDEGRLHSRYKPLHVVTGRLSSEQPNMQNVPRTKDFRRIFGGVEGMTWIKADYSQIELRLAAWHSDEPTMLQAYQDEMDLHRMTASMVLGDESDEARQVGKTLNFGLLYGAGPKTLQRIARTNYDVFFDIETATEYRENFFRAYPGLAAWHEKLKERICITGESRSPLGRVRYLPKAKIPWDVEEMRGQKIHAILEGINHPIQSMASDLLLFSLVRLSPTMRKLGVQIIAEVHDEIDFLCPHGKVVTVSKIIKEEMEDMSWLHKFDIDLTIPVVAEIETGPYWGEVS